MPISKRPPAVKFTFSFWQDADAGMLFSKPIVGQTVQPPGPESAYVFTVEHPVELVTVTE